MHSPTETRTKTFTKAFVVVAFLAAAGAVIASGFIFTSATSHDRIPGILPGRMGGYVQGYAPGYMPGYHPHTPGYIPRTSGYIPGYLK